jgi:hypothetical protein
MEGLAAHRSHESVTWIGWHLIRSMTMFLFLLVIQQHVCQSKPLIRTVVGILQFQMNESIQ